MEGEQKLFRQWFAAIIATIGLFMMGMFLGWPSPSIPRLKAPGSEVHLTEEQISWMVSVLYLGSTLSPIPTGCLMNWVGRKGALMALSTVAIASWSILYTVRTPLGVYIARFLGGMWGGSAYTIVPIYLCEIADPKVRGALNSLFLVLAYCGIMFEYAVGPAVTFRSLSLASAFVPATFVAALLWIPESPYYYLMKGNRKRAGKALAWLRCKEYPSLVEQELSKIEKAVELDMRNKGRFVELVSTAGSRKALLIAQVLAVVQRLSGISVIMAYASAAIPQAGSLTPNSCAILLCVDWILFGFFATVLVGYLGRRSLLALSCAGCALANGMVAAWFYLHTNTDYDAMSVSWFPLVSFLLYGVFFTVGLGCVPNMIQGEMFPANTRGLASGVTSTVISLASFMINKMYFVVNQTVGMYLNFAIFSASCLFGVYFALCVVIETKGKTLGDIQLGLIERTNVPQITTTPADRSPT